MKFSLGVFKSSHQFNILKFSESSRGAENEVHDIEGLKRAEIDAFFYSEGERDETTSQTLQELSKSIPVRSLSDVGLAQFKDSELTFDQAQQALGKAYETWILQNNVSLLDELFSVLSHLKSLWPNERTTFFEELWHLLKINLGTLELKVIFNTLANQEKEGQKNKLIPMMITGRNQGQPQEGTEAEEKIMEHYENEFHQIFNIVDYNPQKGELVAAATINKSPVLIMARALHMTKLQKSLVKALFEGLSSEI